jgi:O-antigen/teichoic acid export membrane protein
MNSGSNVSVIIVRVVLSFIMAPVYVHALGDYDYGLWELVFSVIGYMGLLDMGMRPAVVRYVARYNAVNDHKSLEELFTTSVIFNGTVGLVACIILIAWAIINPEVLAEQHTDANRYVLFLLIIGVQLLFQFPGYIAESFHWGYQRYFLVNNISVLIAVIGTIIVYYLLTHGYGLLTMALGGCLSYTLKYIIYFWLLLSSRYGAFRLRLHWFSARMLKQLVLFGGKSFVMGIAGTVTGGIGKIVIGFILGPAAIPYYAIPARLISYITDFVMSVSNVFMPMFSHLQSRGDDEKLKDLYMVATKYIVGVVCPLAIGVSLLGENFIHRWIGPGYADNSLYIIYFLAAGTTLYMINPLFSLFMTGTGQVGVLAMIKSAGTFMLLVFTLLLIHPYGNEGVAFAYLATYLLMAPYEFFYAVRKLRLKISQFVWQVYAPLILPNIVLFFFVFYIVKWLQPYTYPMIGLVVLSSIPVYLGCFWIFSMATEEKRFLQQKIKERLA